MANRLEKWRQCRCVAPENAAAACERVAASCASAVNTHLQVEQAERLEAGRDIYDNDADDALWMRSFWHAAYVSSAHVMQTANRCKSARAAGTITRCEAADACLIASAAERALLLHKVACVRCVRRGALSVAR